VGGLAYSSVASPYYRETVVVQQSPTVVTQPVIVQQPAVVQTTPTVVSAPVQQTQNIWIEGQYVNQVQADGSTIRVWSPGHYEQRIVQ